MVFVLRECFIRKTFPIIKLPGQGFVRKRLTSSVMTFFVRYGDLIKQYDAPFPEYHKILWSIDPPINQTLH